MKRLGPGSVRYYFYHEKKLLLIVTLSGILYNVGMMEEFLPVFGAGVGAVTKLVRPGRIERIFNVKDVSEYIKRQAEMRERKQYAYTFYETRNADS